jgi:hypothetical protein
VSEEEIDAGTLLMLGEFTPKVSVEIIDQMTKENLEVSPPTPDPDRSHPAARPTSQGASPPNSPKLHSTHSWVQECCCPQIP